MFEDVRQEILDEFQAIHQTYHSSILVNYPNHQIIDLERQMQPFVEVDVLCRLAPQADLGSTDVDIIGDFEVTYVVPEGRGMNGAYEYSDTLLNYLSLRRIGGIVFGEVRILTTAPYTGWRGYTHRISFRTTTTLSCTP